MCVYMRERERESACVSFCPLRERGGKRERDLSTTSFDNIFSRRVLKNPKCLGK